jgi:hypothetical protein
MKKIPIILLAPFFIITLYYVIDKYIYWLFDIRGEGSTFISLMLTTFVIAGIVISITYRDSD